MSNLRITGLWALALLALAFYSCNSDDDSPSNESLLIGSWEIEEENGSAVSYDLELRFDANGEVRIIFSEGTFSDTDFGEYRFLDANTVEIEYDDDDTEVFDILTLTTATLIVRDEDDDEFEFSKD